MGSLLVLVLWTDVFTRFVAFLISLVLWAILWRIAVGIGESEAELRAKR